MDTVQYWKQKKIFRQALDEIQAFLLSICLVFFSGIEIDSSMILTHPDLFVKWTLYNIESGKNIPSTKPSMKFRQKAGTLAKMMIEKEAWKRQLVILENLSCETGKPFFFVKSQGWSEPNQSNPILNPKGLTWTWAKNWVLVQF